MTLFFVLGTNLVQQTILLKQSAKKSTLLSVKKSVKDIHPEFTAQAFSSLKRQGVDQLLTKLVEWYQFPTTKTEPKKTTD